MKKINWSGVLFWVIIALIFAIIALYFLGPLKDPFNNLAAKITSAIQLPTLSLNGVIDYIKNNTALLGAATTLGTLTVTYFVKNYQTNKLLNKTSDELATVKSDLANQTILTDKIKKLETEVDGYKKDTTTQELQKTINSLGDEKEGLNQTILKLKGQLAESKESAYSFYESLWAKSGGQLVEINGEKYKIIEKEIVKVI